jgi:tetratricopeptide (TPR) repeat protein
MNEIEIPEWMKSLREGYDNDPVRWTWIGMTALVVILAAAMVFYMVRKQKQEASELLTKGMQALDQGNYVSARQNFQRIETSMRFSGMSAEARLFSAAALFGLEQYGEAEKAYREFLAAEPSSELAPEAEMGVGACLEMKGDTAGALAVYRGALQKYRNTFASKALEMRVARLARQSGDTPTAAEIYDRLEGDSEGLWREISRGNRRLILSPEAMLTAPASPAAANATAETPAAGTR